MIQGVPLGSAIGPLSLKRNLKDLFFLMKDTDNCNFADDTKTFICDRRTQKVLNSLDENAELAICWLENNFMKLNTVRHLLILGFKH